MEKVNLSAKLARVDALWSPRIVADLNDHEVKVVRVQGEFVWHKHDAVDEMFLVLRGRLQIRFRDRDVELDAGEMLVVPAGVEHMPVAQDEAHVLLIEPRGTRNTGDGPESERTVAAPERI